MKIVITIVLILSGCGFCYYCYKRNIKRDEKQIAKNQENRGKFKKYRVKLRPINSTEGSQTIVTFDLMAPNAMKATSDALFYLDPWIECWETVEVTEFGEEG